MPDSSDRSDPFLSFRFRVQFDDLPPGGFSDCTGLQMEAEVQDFNEGGLNTHSWKFFTRAKQAPLVLKRGIVNTTLWDWFQSLRQGDMKFRNGTILVFDDGGKNVVMEFQVLQAFPTKWVGPELNATQSNVAIETLELVHQGMERRL